MTFETDLFNLLKAVTPRVFPDFAPVSTPRPYVTFQQVGGAVINYADNTDPDAELPDIQVNVWAAARAEAKALIRQIESAMRAASAFSARPISAAVSDFDADVPVYGSRQDFSCWHKT